MDPNGDHPFVKKEETISSPREKREAQSLIERVSGKICRESTGRFIHSGTKERSDEPANWPPEKIQLDSGYNDWKYWNGVIHLAFLRIASESSREELRRQVAENYRFAFRHLDLFRDLYEAGIPDCPFHQFFRLDRLDDFGAMSCGLMEVLKTVPVPGAEAYLEQVARFIARQQERLEDRTFCRRRFGITTLWADDLYMSVPFLVRMYRYYGEESFLEDAIHQSDRFHHHLFRPENQLYFHCLYPDSGRHGVAHWSRANGWVIMARVELLDSLPQGHPYRQQCADLLMEQITGLSRYQGRDGLWHQLLDKTDSFSETSGTSMFTYAIARGVNQGWIPDHYSSIALRAWEGLKGYISPGDTLEGVSQGFNIRQDLPFYYNQPLEPGGAHGVGAFLLAAHEISKMKPFRDCVWA